MDIKLRPININALRRLIRQQSGPQITVPPKATDGLPHTGDLCAQHSPLPDRDAGLREAPPAPVSGSDVTEGTPRDPAAASGNVGPSGDTGDGRG